MELKFDIDCFGVLWKQDSNRTFMELKLGKSRIYASL